MGRFGFALVFNSLNSTRINAMESPDHHEDPSAPLRSKYLGKRAPSIFVE